MTSNKNNKHNKIIGIQFSILSPDEIRNGSVAEITNRDTYVNNKPVIGGLFDPRMGILEPGYICPTDGLDYINTPGYFGHIELARPVFYIQYIQTIIKILKCVCIKCSKLLINKQKHKHCLNMKNDERWNYVFNCSSKIKRCGEECENGCGCKQPLKIKKQGLATLIAEWDPKLFKEIEDLDEKKLSIKLIPELVLKIFKRISDEDVNFMGFNSLWSRPDWMICQVLAVPPPAVRPSVKHDSQQRSEDDLSHIIVNIIKANEKLHDKVQQNAAENIIDDWQTVLQYFIATLVDNKIPGVHPVSQRSGRPLKSIKERLNGKTGRVRGNLMGKRVDFSARSVITPDPNLSIRELGIPLKIAKNLTKPVIVNDKNKKFLSKLVQNGPDEYPGAKIYEKKNGDSISLRYVDRSSITLENGDTVHRHMMDGDAILFNRQPTLHRMSMMCHICRIMKQGDTFRMNVGATKPYNADFDGDEMNLHMPQDEESEIELRKLAAIPYQIISPANNKSIIGIFQDSLLGAYLFTRNKIDFDKRMAMNLLMHFNEIDLTKINFQNDKITNFEILTQITPLLSLKYKTKRFMDTDDYATSNNVLEIQDGKYIRGIMEKGVLGDTSKGLLQRIYNDFSPINSSNFIDNLQNVVTEFMKYTGYSVGISDLIANTETNDEIKKIIYQKQIEVRSLIDQTHLGIFENKTGKTNQDEFEQQVNNILNRASAEAGKIARNNLDNDNRFVIMVNAGSKGSDLNISQMISCLGQQNVDGKRIPYGFENRTLPHFTKYDDSPGARGFVENSFIGGLNPQELFFHAMGGRVGLIDTAVKSVTWETPIVIIENNEPRYVKIGEFVDNKMNNNNLVEKHNERNLELLNTNNIYIPTTNEDGIVSWEEVTALTRHDPGNKLYQIKTLGGRDVIVTENKSLLIWQSSEKKLKEMFSTDIKIGDCVPVTKDLCEPPVIKNYILLEKYLSKKEYIYGTDFNIACKLMKENMNNKKKVSDNWWNKNNTINFTLPYTKKSSLQRCIVRSNFENINDRFVYPYSDIRNNTEVPEKFELNNNNGIFIGLFLAEGHINNSHITITNNNIQIRNFVKSWFDNYNIKYNEKIKINKLNGTTTTITGNSCIMSEFITKLVGSGAKNKYVPDEAFTAPEEFIIGLLNGYFSGDGYISNNSIEASSASKRLIEGVNMLCSRLSIFGKVFTTIMKKNNINTKNILPAHRISIRAQWGKLFADKINLIDDNKNRKLNNANFTNMHRNFITYNNVVLDKIIEINIIGVENHPKMYDLTIPTTLNFGLANGLQVRDTSQTGYIQRRLVKSLEDLMVNYDMTVRNNKNKIIQYVYGDDNFDPVHVETQTLPFITQNIEDIYNHFQVLNINKDDLIKLIFNKPTLTRQKREQMELNKKTKQYIDYIIEKRSEIVENVFKNTDNKNISMPVSFNHLINNIKGKQPENILIDITLLEAFEIIENAFEKLNNIYYAKPNNLFKVLYFYYLSPKDLIINKRFTKVSLELLMVSILKCYKESIVAPGEMVGMIAAQSIGEPTTQMSETRNAVKKIIIVSKNGNISHKSIKIGDLCDDFIEKYPQYTFPTGHPNSVETILEKLEDKYYIVGVDKNEKTYWNQISHFSRHPVNGDLITIRTKSGRTVTTTLSHSHLTRKDHKVEPIKGSELNVGMRIPVCKHINNTFIKETINIGNNSYKLDKLFGWFIGAYLAEGNCSGNEICITNISEHYINNTIKFAKLFNLETSIDKTPGQYGPATKTKFKHKELAKFLLNECGKNSFEKKVPDFIFTAPLECKSAVLQGYMDGDGNINCDKNHHEIRACSRSEQLIKDLSLLFNYFDIFTTLIQNIRQQKPFYHLAISVAYSELYEKHIGSVLKNDKLQELCEYNKRPNVHSLSNDIDKIEGLGEIIAYCGKELKLPGQSRNYGRWKNKSCIGRRTLIKYIEIFKEAIGEKRILQNEIMLLEQAAYSNIIWDEIVDIEIYTPDQNEYVYDFTVPGNQTFMEDNGILVHNTLNTFHFAGISSKSNVTRGVPRIEEILSLSENPKNPSCTVYFNKLEQHNKEKAKEYMNNLEHTKLKELIEVIEIYYDPGDMNTLIEEDKNIMSQYDQFEKLLDECGADLEDKKDKSKWIIRFKLNKENMLDKNLTMEDIHFAINNSHKDTVSCIYSDYNSDNLIFRLRLNAITSNKKKPNVQENLDQSDEIYILKNFQNELLENLIIRGVKNINKVLLRKITDNVEESEGKFDKKEYWVLDTVGTNLLDILALNYIDKNRTYSNDIQEIYRVFGIEAARQSIFNEISEVIEFDSTYINYHHLTMLCDRMCCNNKMVSVFRHGINNDDIGPIAKASFEETPEMFLKAARHGELDNMKGVSSNIMCGQEGYFGTSSFQVILDLKEVIELNKVSEEEEINIPKSDEEYIEKEFGEISDPNDECSINNLSINIDINNLKHTDMGNNNDYNPGF